jgi:hypothetical protein
MFLAGLQKFTPCSFAIRLTFQAQMDPFCHSLGVAKLKGRSLQSQSSIFLVCGAATFFNSDKP